MKLYLSILLSIFCFLIGRSQATNKLESTGNAGVGTISPVYPFEITPTGLVSRLGGDPSAVGIGSIGTTSVNSFIGGYYAAAGGYPTSYIGSNIYFTNSGWISPDNTKSASMVMLQSGGLNFLTSPVGGGYGTIKMVVNNAGLVGIGTTSPTERLTIASSWNAGYKSMLSLNESSNNGNNSMGIDFKFGGASGYPWGSTGRIEVARQLTSASFDMLFHTATNGVLSEKMRILNNGNVGIGTITPAATLDVNGTTYSRKMYVGLPDANIITNMGSNNLLAVNGTAVFVKAKVAVYGQTTWPDYVFSPSYNLTPLDSLEQFIQLNKHLPEIPSATDVQKNGIDLGDTQVLLLKKIEELTLIIIEQNKRIEKLELISKAIKDK
jgi:hypothetical protein